MPTKHIGDLPLIGLIAGAAAPLKVAVAASTALVASAAASSIALFAQVTGSDGATVGTLIPAGALTATSGALVWVVKQIVSGSLVHRDPATAEAKLAETLTIVTKITADALRREEVLTDLLVQKRRDGNA